MPKKKTVKTEVPEVVKEVQAIIDQQASKDLGVKIENGNIAKEPSPVTDEKEITTEKVEKPVETKADEPVAEFDADEFANKVAEQTKAKIEEERLKGIEEQAKKELEEKSKDELLPVWTREGRNPKDYDEIAAESTRIAELRFNKILEEKEAKSREIAEQEQSKKQQEQSRIDAYNKLVDEELEELYASDKLPKIKDQNDPNDLGVKERFNLFKTMKEVNDKRIAEGKDPIYSVHRIYNGYYKPTKQPAGADLPISSGKSPAPPADAEQEYSYADIHNKRSILDFFKRK